MSAAVELAYPAPSPRLQVYETLRKRLVEVQQRVSCDDIRTHALLHECIGTLDTEMLAWLRSDDPNSELMIALRAEERLSTLEERVNGLLARESV